MADVVRVARDTPDYLIGNDQSPDALIINDGSNRYITSLISSG